MSLDVWPRSRAEAGDHATCHLQPDGDGYVCSDTGRRWTQDDGDPVQTRLARV